MRRLALLLLGGGALLLPTTPAQAQQAATRSWLVKVVPQHVVLSGYWLEVEKSWSQHPQHSLIVTPQAYAGPTGRPDLEARQTDRNSTVRGAGLQVQHRWYPLASAAAYPAGFYVSYGPNFQHFAVSHNAFGWNQVLDPTGLPRYEYRDIRHTTTINRYGASVQLGYQAPLPPGPVFLDLYVGLGWRSSHSRSSSEAAVSSYRSGPSDYGHGGMYFPAGVKIGVALR